MYGMEVKGDLRKLSASNWEFLREWMLNKELQEELLKIQTKK